MSQYKQLMFISNTMESPQIGILDVFIIIVSNIQGFNHINKI